MSIFGEIWTIIGSVKGKNVDNLGQNISELYNVLVQIRLITSKTNGDV